jgi:hypothetical protein
MFPWPTYEILSMSLLEASPTWAPSNKYRQQDGLSQKNWRDGTIPFVSGKVQHLPLCLRWYYGPQLLYGHLLWQLEH